MKFRGILDPNAVLRGETSVKPGDTFIAASEDNHGFAAMRYSPDETVDAWRQFPILAVGTRETCEAAIAALLS